MPFDRVHLDNRAVRPAFQKHKEISIGAPDAAGLVHLERIMGRSSWLIGDLSGEVNVSGRKDAGIHIMIDGLFGKHDLIGVVGADMVDGLALADQWRDKGVKRKSFVFGDTDTGTGFREKGFILLLGKAWGVDMFFESTVFSFRAAIADIRRPG